MSDLDELQVVGYKIVRNGNTPTKQIVTLANFVNPNTFQGLSVQYGDASGGATTASNHVDMSEVCADELSPQVVLDMYHRLPGPQNAKTTIADVTNTKSRRRNRTRKPTTGSGVPSGFPLTSRQAKP